MEPLTATKLALLERVRFHVNIAGAKRLLPNDFGYIED